MSINNVTLVGNISTEPEIRTTQAGVNCVTFNIAVNRPRSKAQAEAGQQPTADFIRCTAWRKTADFIQQYFHKGSPIAFTGRIQTDQWTDQSGNKRYSTGVVVENVSFVGRKSDNQQGGNGGYAQPQQAYAQPQPQYQQPQQAAPVTPMNNGYQQGGYAAQPQYQQQPAQQVGMNYGGGFTELDADEDLPF